MLFLPLLLTMIWLKLQPVTYGEIGEFPMTIGLHQGLTLSPYLFALIMDESIALYQQEVPQCMLFVDDIALDDEERGVNLKHERW